MSPCSRGDHFVLVLGRTDSLKPVVVQIKGNITYNGHTFQEFVPERTSAYVNQYDEVRALLWGFQARL